MNTIQRVILWLGCNGLILVWLLPPTFHVHSDGTRLESNWHWVWSLPHEWSVNTPLLGWRIVTVVLVTAGFFIVFRHNPTKGGAK